MGQVSLDLIVAKIDSVPTLPVVASRVGELVNDPDAGAADIARVMKDDQALTARVLALVNSAYYGVPGGVSDVRRAISYLGFNAIYQLVLTVSVFKTLPLRSGSGFDLSELWKHSLGTAIISEAVGKHLRHQSPEELFTAGLLHDIGKVALSAFASDVLERVVEDAERDGTAFIESERELGLPGHDLIGRKLAEKWRLPGNIIAGIGYHHKVGGPVLITQAKKAVADMVALADALCRRSGVGHGGDPLSPRPSRELLEALNLTEREVRRLQDSLPRAIERSKTFLEILT